MDEIKKRFIRVAVSKTFNRILDILQLRKTRVLDIGCGYGEYLVLFGKGSIGITTTDDEVVYGKKNNINIIKGNIEEYFVLKNLGFFEAIWANNLFEHLLSPHEFLIQLKLISKDDTTLILGVPVIPKIHSLIKLNKFRGTLASNHISFFTRESLRYSVQYAGWNVEQIRPFIFSNKFLDNLAGFLAPHLYIVAHNDSNFVYPEKKQKEWAGEEKYEHLFDIIKNK